MAEADKAPEEAPKEEEPPKEEEAAEEEAPKQEEAAPEEAAKEEPAEEAKGDKSEAAEESSDKYKVGDKVEIKPNKKGQILYVGEPKGWGGKWYGIRLTEKRGDCDGEWKDQRFFRCEKNFGQYVKQRDIIKILGDDEADFDFTSETQQLEEEKKEDEKKYTAEKDKLAKLKQVFKDTDKDGSLSLDEAEFVKMATESLGCNEDEAKSLFKQIDVSGNGSVSFAEFDAWLGDGGVTKLEQYTKLTTAFKDADKDGNLTLDCEEFKKLAKEAMELDEKDAQELFERVDANKNGNISFDEFEAYIDDLGGIENIKQFSELKKAFADADKDKSNGLDEAEFIKLAKEKLDIPSYKSKKLFSKIDTNGNGTIQFDEFEAYVNRIGGVRKLKEKEEKEAKKAAEKKAPAKKAPAKTGDAKKPAAKKGDAKKPAGKDAKKPAAKKDAAKKPAAKKGDAKKPAPKKATGKDAAAKKPAVKKDAAGKDAAKKPAAKKATTAAKKPAAKDAKKPAVKDAKKPAAGKDAKKPAPKKAATGPAKKAAGKDAAKKPAAKKAAAKTTDSKKKAAPKKKTAAK